MVFRLVTCSTMVVWCGARFTLFPLDRTHVIQSLWVVFHGVKSLPVCLACTSEFFFFMFGILPFKDLVPDGLLP